MPKDCTVLIVDDEALIRMQLASIFSDRGCKVYEARDAAEAIAIMESNSEITVVFTDIQMPGTMDGLALANFVRERWPPTIIVVSSGKVQPEKGVLAEDVSFLEKPFQDRHLFDVLEKVQERLRWV